MTASEPPLPLSRDELLALVAALRRQLTELTAHHEAFRAELEQLKRRDKRQAAPFSKGTRGAQPKRPGRKPGTGSFCYRAPPPPDQMTALPVEVPVRLAVCPDCGGQLLAERIDWASTTALPAWPRPTVTTYRVAVCRCILCGKPVRGQHPDVAPDQYGATAHRVGARAMAAAHALHYGVGLPVRKGPLVLEALNKTLTRCTTLSRAAWRSSGTVALLGES